MGESWFWIKQRPHFIAEYLSKYYETDLVFEKRYTSRVNNVITDNIKCYEIFKLPKTHNPIIRNINGYLIKKGFKKFFKNNKYDLILLNNCHHFNMIKEFITKDDFIVYDCMDDFTEFKGSKKDKKTLNDIIEKEKELYKRSDVVVFSSDYLKESLRKRYGEKQNSLIINNAIEISSFKNESKLPDTLNEIFVNGKKNFCYLGSISDWFDFELVIEMLDKFKDVNFILVGPSDINIPKHNRLKWHGQIEHNYIMSVMKKADMLVMPFKVNELIKSVNPVKVYEYIYSGVPSLVISYGETEKFRDFVYLYRDKKEFLETIGRWTENKLKPLSMTKESLKFAEENTWEIRVKTLKKFIEENTKK